MPRNSSNQGREGQKTMRSFHWPVKNKDSKLWIPGGHKSLQGYRDTRIQMHGNTETLWKYRVINTC